jgi:hypothetical protein
MNHILPIGFSFLLFAMAAVFALLALREGTSWESSATHQASSLQRSIRLEIFLVRDNPIRSDVVLCRG